MGLGGGLGDRLPTLSQRTRKDGPPAKERQEESVGF
jgi:hypothetical protein